MHVGTSWQFPAARSLRSSSATRVSGMRHRPMSRMPKPCEHQRLTDDSLVGHPALLRRVAVSDGEIVLFGMAPSPVCPIGQGFFGAGGGEVIYTTGRSAVDCSRPHHDTFSAARLGQGCETLIPCTKTRPGGVPALSGQIFCVSSFARFYDSTRIARSVRRPPSSPSSSTGPGNPL